ncbi:hypothetical protein HU755_16765 [Pseudomonas sp. SWRI111]|uniref:Ig-like domain-containing protein n=1 Tax=Pseudomonas sp. SWRI111 TaxID=2745507 RepID=UPI001645AF7B|nr:Ig-like domain-containing protein [Pseudomonas sp. SWRI111]MBC3208458.1 hypothetical protein [Pseudomonas sp. SWRI111]
MPAGSISLFPPYDDENQPLALRPILIAGMQTPVEDGDGGINFKTATDYPEGLLCAIDTYPSPMKEGDKLEIHYNGGKILERWVAADEVDQRVFFYLPAPEQSGWIEDCHYVLTRAGETVPDPPSASLRLWVKLYKPGNRDKEPHLPDGHSELNIVQLPTELIEQGVIDAEWAKKGVLVTVPFYVYITRNDQIRLQLGSYSLPAHLVTQAQAEHKEPIEVYINQEAILGAGDGNQLEIKYDVNDEVWNWADRHSKRTCIDVDAGGWRLEAPIIKEAFNKVITIRDLDKKPVTVQIHVRGDEFDLGDTLTMTWLGKPPNNGKPISRSETRIIDNIPSVLEIPVPYEEVRAIAQGTADASYILYKKDGGDPLSSERALADVVGDVDMLPEPILLQLLGDTLDPDEPNATVEVRYAMKNGDLINLVWLGKKSNDQPYLHEQPHTVSENDARQGWVRFDVNAEHISVLRNGTLDLSYRVANDDSGLYDVRESERLLARVETVRATLPKPVVEEAEPPGDVLDPSKVFDNVHVLIAEANTVRGDVLTYYWRSPNPFGSTSDWLPITTVSEGEPVRFRVDARFVTANIGERVQVRYSLRRAASGQYEYSATLELLVADWVSPTISSVVDAKGSEIPNSGITFDTSVTITGKASPGQTVQLYDGNTAITPVVTVDASGNWSRVLSALSIAAHAIKAKALYGAQPESAVRGFTVAQTVTPTIVEIRDSTGPVAPNGITFDTSVTITGKASPGQTVQLYDGNTAITPVVTVDASGNWSRVLSALSIAVHAIKAKALYGAQPESAVRSFTVESWIDSVTDFANGTAGNWIKGPAGNEGRIVNGLFHNDTQGGSGHSGMLFSQSFRFVVGQTYSFSYRLRNFSPLVNNLPPIFSVKLSSGQQILPVYNVPRDGKWYIQTANFSVTQSADYTIQVMSHQDRGGGSGAEGGNDYQIDDIIVRRVR